MLFNDRKSNSARHIILYTGTLLYLEDAQLKRCPRCGEINDDIYYLCVACGTKLPNASDTISQNPERQAKGAENSFPIIEESTVVEKKGKTQRQIKCRKNRIIIMAIIGLVVLTTVLIIAINQTKTRQSPILPLEQNTMPVITPDVSAINDENIITVVETPRIVTPNPIAQESTPEPTVTPTTVPLVTPLTPASSQPSVPTQFNTPEPTAIPTDNPVQKPASASDMLPTATDPLTNPKPVSASSSDLHS